ncbi:putative hydrogenase nickel incorporation protein HypA [Anopheles sinensis]|uniref:Putative hydrogenase nickel incorporation protein HypA n=1 Tax=Anopheles sinensis TaxID=74873 RepID=A0A084VK90_ANOSI|nr:putative hydrogenase nickel incorporation protein HypA [Anopheles sinensis]
MVCVRRTPIQKARRSTVTVEFLTRNRIAGNTWMPLRNLHHLSHHHQVEGVHANNLK